MSWTTELAAAETAENTYRTNAKGSHQNNYFRFDGRGAVLLGNWITSRAATSSVKVPPSNSSYWGNVAARAVVNMGASWTVVQDQITPLVNPGVPPGYGEMGTHQPFGFVQLDGLFGGLIDKWSTDVWVASGRTVPSAAFPPQELWSYLFANSITIAGAT
jgi:hypothetical protein